jgi:hypothetical protein
LPQLVRTPAGTAPGRRGGKNLGSAQNVYRHRMLRALISTILRSPVAWFMCVFLIILSEAASAHGPCGERCLEPNEGPLGTPVSTDDLVGVLAIWNPRPETLSLGAPGTSGDCDTRCARQLEIYHLDQPSIVLAETRTRQQLHFRVPDVPAGRYLVVVYDGSENRHHYTWQPFTVTPSGSLEPSEVSSQSRRLPWLFGILAIAGGFCLGWVLKSRLVSANPTP